MTHNNEVVRSPNAHRIARSTGQTLEDLPHADQEGASVRFLSDSPGVDANSSTWGNSIRRFSESRNERSAGDFPLVPVSFLGFSVLRFPRGKLCNELSNIGPEWCAARTVVFECGQTEQAVCCRNICRLVMPCLYT